MDAVIKAAARTGTAIEINAHPLRLDMDWRLCKRAKEVGVRCASNSDAHNANDRLDHLTPPVQHLIHHHRHRTWHNVRHHHHHHRPFHKK